MESSGFFDHAIQWAWTSLVGGIVWIHRRIAKNEEGLANHKLYAAENFVRKDDMKEMRRELNDKLNQIINKLDTKADK